MGTRHMTFVQLNGEYKIAQYGQWDGYPNGQGATILNFLTNTLDKCSRLTEFAIGVGALVPITQQKLEDRWVECGAERGAQMISLDVSDRMKRRYPHLQRDCGAEVLDLVLRGHATEVHLRTEFAKDGLFCEWAYVIDLDKRVLEVYKGLNTEPLTPEDRFYFGGAKGDTLYPSDEEGKPPYCYYPVRLVKSYSLNEPLPTVKQMVEDCDPPEPGVDADE